MCLLWIAWKKSIIFISYYSDACFLIIFVVIFMRGQIVELLIFKGANIHELDEEGNDALTLSVKHNQPEIIAVSHWIIYPLLIAIHPAIYFLVSYGDMFTDLNCLTNLSPISFIFIDITPTNFKFYGNIQEILLWWLFSFDLFFKHMRVF